MSRQGQNRELRIICNTTHDPKWKPKGEKIEVTNDKLLVMAFSANLHKECLPDEY